MAISLEDIKELDASDPLGQFRRLFQLNETEVYLDGNSLGAMPFAAKEVAQAVLTEQWGNSQIRAWNTHQWATLADRIGDKIGRLIGAESGEVVCAESTGVNLYKAMAVALKLNPERRIIVMEGSNFPTNNYVVQGLIDQLGSDHEIRFIEREDNWLTDLDADVAVVCLTQVHYKTGAKFNMSDVTQKVQAAGALMLWDLCHSTGAFPVDVSASNVDLAVGCTYKYLNGGPGSPAYIYLASRHHNRALQPVTGWWGHQAPFNFLRDYQPAEGIRQMFTGTPSIIALSVMEAGIDLMSRVDMNELHEKSQRLTSLFIDLIHQECAGHSLKLVTPNKPEERGSQVSFSHSEGYPIMQALIASGVIGDFRAPDILRFGFAPLYNRYQDVWDAVKSLQQILDTEQWREERFSQRQAVT